MSHAVAGTARARAWVEHLRRGGAEPWRSFAAAERSGPDAAADGPLPGAVQLEVARRLNALDGRDDPAHRRLVSRVLATSGPGRGRHDLPLAGTGTDRRFGHRPVDPADVPVDELLRVAVGALVQHAVAADPPPVGEAPAGVRRPLRARLAGWRRGYALVGDPLLVAPTREALLAAGRDPGTTPRTAVVMADDLSRMLADAWAWRVCHGAGASWPRWLDRLRRDDRLPPAADPARLADDWARRLGPDRVHVVAGPEAPALAGRVLGTEVRVGGVARPSYAALRVLREANLVLRVLVPRERHAALLRATVLPLLAEETGAPPAVPARHRDWVARRGAEQRARLAAGRYALHGDPAPAPAAGGASDEDVLGAALRALLRTRTTEEA